ncbi:MAG: sulfotransferase domain-containing protein, partial [Flavobacteriales bacterium]|nr:sulfotransferase domain-containing protein [Flavobacteriales bacterium]
NNMYLYYFNSNQIFSYEDLLLSFDDNVRAISTQLSLGNLSDEEILGIKKQTSINSMRDQLEKGESTYYSTVKRNKSRLIRKGKSGDWRNHFKSQHLEDIYRIENGKFSIFNKLVYIFIFSLRRIIFRIE